MLHVLQEIDIAVVKSTAAQFHVVPKEKHVRSKCLQESRCFTAEHLQGMDTYTLFDTGSLVYCAHD